MAAKCLLRARAQLVHRALGCLICISRKEAGLTTGQPQPAVTFLMFAVAGTLGDQAQFLAMELDPVTGQL